MTHFSPSYNGVAVHSLGESDSLPGSGLPSVASARSVQALEPAGGR